MQPAPSDALGPELVSALRWPFAPTHPPAFAGVTATMTRSIILGTETVPYDWQIQPRLRGLGLRLYQDGRLIVSSPASANERRIEAFLREKADWILRKRLLFKKRSVKMQTLVGTYDEYKLMALELAKNRLAYFNRAYGFTYRNITIKRQKTRWGSCSSQGNLNFHYRLALLPPELADYLVVHELCHLGQMNHSDKFWALVAKTVPDHKLKRKQLKTYSLA